MPDHDEELKRFRQRPREEPDKKFSDAFKFFARKIDLKEEINNPKATKSKKTGLKDQYIELIENDSKVLEKELLKAKRQPKHLGTEDRIKGGKAPKYDFGLQQFVNQLFTNFKSEGQHLTPSSFKRWLEANALRGDGYESHILDCDDIEFYDGKIWWKDRTGKLRGLVERSLEPYIQRARKSAGIERA